MSLVLLLGGARAGKSVLAVRFAERSGSPVTYIATARRSDRDMAERIERHRSERPEAWTTIEEPLNLERAICTAAEDSVLIVDCLTLWTSNLMLEGRTDVQVTEEARSVAELVASRRSPAFVVSNEVGSGVHPSTEVGRRFRDLLGRVNAIWSERADEAFLVVAGRTITLEGQGRL
jgi:adenosylcobinamide kinase/adenosylcobinamide-phosphate guanylyltransferase